jgi:CheY-like chemotaxis protein/anti-sigma regulatory factor (Ser/Thr protein kinase)
VPADYLLSTVVNDVINISNMKVHDSNLRFIVDVDGNIPNSLYGDAVRIRQVLLNLISNAVKYTEKGFVSLSVTGKISDDTIRLRMDISDSGIGIKAEDQKRLFQDFTQFDVERNIGIEGSGLGLAISQNLVKAMGGEILVRSEYGKGSTFTVLLTQKILTYDKLAVVRKPWNKHVLVFERRELFMQSIARTMEGLGVDYKIVTNAREFYKEIKSDEFNYIMVSIRLYENILSLHGKLETNAILALITEFNESAAEHNASVIAAPLFSIPLAKFLNGSLDTFSSSVNLSAVAKFTAPDARVLIVDDIQTNLKVAEGLMLPYKMKIDLCKSGRAAIAAVQEHRYDIVFMDHMMPGMNGVEATNAIRALKSEDSYYSSLPIVALTANAVSGTKEMFMENDFNDFISKPIDTAHLNTVLAKWLPQDKKIR